MSNPANLTIVLAEDDDGHASLIERNLKRAGLKASLLRTRNGLELMQLFGNSGIQQTQRTVVLLDLRMPHMDGMQTLRRLKSDEGTATIPVFVLSTTDDEREIEECFRLGCNAYLTKPVEYDKFADLLQRLALFLEIAAVPGPSSGPER